MKQTSFLQTLAVGALTLSAFTLTACNSDKSQQEQAAVTSEATQTTTDNATTATEQTATEAVEKNTAETADATAMPVADNSVNYLCDNDESIAVTYEFDETGAPVVAKFEAEGQVQTLPVNPQYTDETAVMFGEEATYMLSTNAINASNYKQSSIIVTNPAQEIIYKNCDAKQ